MYTRAQCQSHVGQWVQFRTKYGYHIGLVERVTGDSAIVLSPRQQIPTHLASADVDSDDMQKLDLALAWWGGFGRAGYPGAGYRAGAPGAGAYGGGYGGRGFGGFGGYGWGRWAVSFLIIYALWGLLLW
jgi:hypothetical protein